MLVPHANVVQSTCTVQYRDPATLPEPPENELSVETHVFIPDAYGGTTNDLVFEDGSITFTQGDEETVLKGVSWFSGFPVDRRAYKSINVDDVVDDAVCSNTHPDAQLAFGGAAVLAYKARHEGSLATSTEVMASDGSPVPVPELLAPFGMQLKKVDEERFELEYAAPQEVIEFRFDKPSGGELYGVSSKSPQSWSLRWASWDDIASWQDAGGDNKTQRIVEAGSKPFVIHYTYLEGLVAAPMALSFPMPATHPDSLEPSAIDAGDIVSATRHCERRYVAGEQTLADTSKMVLTVAVPLPTPDAKVVAWDSLRLHKALLDSGDSLQLSQPIHATTMTQRWWSGDDDFMGVARMHEGEMLLDVAVTPVCEPNRLKKFMGSVDLLVSERSTSTDILLEDGVTEWIDPEGQYHLKLEVEDRDDVDLRITGAAERMDFELLDSSGAAIEVDRQRASRRGLSTSLDIDQKEALPEGAVLRVTVHRDLSRHTASFSAKRVPLP